MAQNVNIIVMVAFGKKLYLTELNVSGIGMLIKNQKN